MAFSSDRVRSSIISTAWIIESSSNDGGTEADDLSFLHDDSERWAAKYRVFGPVRRSPKKRAVQLTLISDVASSQQSTVISTQHDNKKSKRETSSEIIIKTKTQDDVIDLCSPFIVNLCSPTTKETSVSPKNKPLLVLQPSIPCSRMRLPNTGSIPDPLSNNVRILPQSYLDHLVKRGFRKKRN